VSIGVWEHFEGSVKMGYKNMGEWATRLTSEESQSLTFCSSLCLLVCGNALRGADDMGYKNMAEQATRLISEKSQSLTFHSSLWLLVWGTL
jgi:hypothetical protein